jgi:FtsZ-binding cell division protein ZapB
MNDKEAFEKWRLEYISTHTGYFKMIGTDDLSQVVWQAACAYKQKEIDELKTQDQIIAKEIKTYRAIAEKLQAENAKLRECVEYEKD